MKKIYIKADKYKLKQVMVNLIKNAIEAKDKSFSKLNVSLQKFSTYAELKIWDNGKGIEKEELERLFEPFNSSKLNGTGLGLAIVKDIITNHSGTIEFNSEAGNWTEITIKLPIYKEELMEEKFDYGKTLNLPRNRFSDESRTCTRT